MKKLMAAIFLAMLFVIPVNNVEGKYRSQLDASYIYVASDGELAVYFDTESALFDTFGSGDRSLDQNIVYVWFRVYPENISYPADMPIYAEICYAYNLKEKSVSPVQRINYSIDGKVVASQTERRLIFYPVADDYLAQASLKTVIEYVAVNRKTILARNR